MGLVASGAGDALADRADLNVRVRRALEAQDLRLELVARAEQLRVGELLQQIAGLEALAGDDAAYEALAKMAGG